MKIDALDIVTDIGGVWQPCDLVLKMPYHQPIVSMKKQHRQRLPDRQASNGRQVMEDKR